MCVPCKSNKMRVWSFMENRMTGYPIKFDQNEVEELKRKFKKISGNKEIIDKVSFQENMGILGLSSVEGFSDRLFNSFDTDTDGKISFQDFVEYMEVLKSGSEKNKAKISYRLIDIRNQNRVDVKGFKEFLEDYFRSWTSITNSLITPEIRERTDDYVERVFSKVKKETGKNYIDFAYYAEKIFFDQEFIDAFEFITEGVANMFIAGQKFGEDSNILYKVLKSIRQINNALTNGSEKLGGLRSNDNDRFSGSSSGFKNQDQSKLKIPILSEEFPLTPTAHSQKGFQNLNISNNNLSFKNQTQTTLGANSFTSGHTKADTHLHQTNYLNQTANPINESSSQTHQCKNCLRVEVLEKKLEFITSKIKKIVEETQKVYERLDEKLFEKTSVKKKQTMGNIHLEQRTTEGNMIFFGDDNWNEVLNMMIGIQMAVRSVRGYQEMVYEEPKDFNLKYYFELVPRRFGDYTALSRICSFTDYAPNTFNHIRKIFNIDNEEYINSIGPNKLMTSLMMGEVSSLSGLTSQGKSGSFFYYTADGKYMLKTIKYREYKHLRKILEDYYHYIKQNPSTLITKFFGLHKLISKDVEGDTIAKSYFVIMANVFNTKEKIIERYDIKGSSYSRETKSTHPNTTKKDNDFKNNKKPLEINPSIRRELMKIIAKDAEFFRSHDIIDYSLLIGIVKKDGGIEESKPKIRPSQNGKLREKEAMEYENYELRESHMYENINNNEEYIFGIIDILTEYTSLKAAEYYFKSLLYGKGVSAVPPDHYSERFVNFIHSVVLKNYDQNIGPANGEEEEKNKQRNSREDSRNKMQLVSRDSAVTSYHFRSKDSLKE